MNYDTSVFFSSSRLEPVIWIPALNASIDVQRAATPAGSRSGGILQDMILAWKKIEALIYFWILKIETGILRINKAPNTFRSRDADLHSAEMGAERLGCYPRYVLKLGTINTHGRNT